MSDLHQEKLFYYFAAGVFKLDHMSAGFPELQAIAQRWSEEDPNFHQLILRKVSANNYGISFVYFTTENASSNMIRKYQNELGEKFKKGLYAWDFQESSGEEEEDLERVKKMVVISKPIDI